MSEKRCGLLRALGEDHRRAVAAAARLRAATEGEGSLEEATELFLKTWRGHIMPHYRKEEEVLLPDLARRVPEGDAVIMLTLNDHVTLRRLVREVERAGAGERRALVAELGRRLEEHVRFEETTLFPALEKTLGRSRLAELEGELARSEGDFGFGAS